MTKATITLISVAAVGMFAAASFGQVTITSSDRMVYARSYFDNGNDPEYKSETVRFESTQVGQFDEEAIANGSRANMGSGVSGNLIEGSLYADASSYRDEPEVSQTYAATSRLAVDFTVGLNGSLTLDILRGGIKSDGSSFLIRLSSGENILLNINDDDVDEIPDGPLERQFGNDLEPGDYTLLVRVSPGVEYAGSGFVNQYPTTVDFVMALTSDPVRPYCPADLFKNGVVDTADLAGLINAFGDSPVPYGYGDMNGDGLVDTADLGHLIASFGPCTE